MNLEEHICLLTKGHPAHDWWYTSESGGHMIRDPKHADRTATVKGWHCPGIQSHTYVDKVKVYHEVETRKVLCDLGHKHNQDVYFVKTIFNTGVINIQDNGYFKYSAGVFADVQGRTYQELMAFDSGRRYYIREDGLYFTKDLTTGAIDVLGRRL